MKKKIVAFAMVFALAAVAVVGGSLAYFTDTDNKTNTFTAGGVAIDLIEQQVNEDGTELEDFKQDQILLPIVGSAQGDKNEFGQPVAANYIDKMVTVENTGKSDAWVRAYFAIPSALDDGAETYNAGLNILHFNFGNVMAEDGLRTTYENEWKWKDDNGAWKSYVTIIDGVSYNVYYADYYKPLPADKSTVQFVSGVYLDKDVDMNSDGNYTITRNGETKVIENFDGTVSCPVFAVAVQAAGFDNASEAVDAAFGVNFDPFTK